MTTQIAVFAAVIALAASLFDRAWLRYVATFAAGAIAIAVASWMNTPGTVLATLGGGVLIGGALNRRSDVVSDALGISFIATSAFVSEMSVGGSALFPIRLGALAFAGFGVGWLIESWAWSRTRRIALCGALVLLVATVGMALAFPIEASMLRLPVATDAGDKAFLVVRMVETVEAVRFAVPVESSLVALASLAASLPLFAYFVLARPPNKEPSNGRWLFMATVGVAALLVAAFVIGRTPSFLAGVPGVDQLELFRPASVTHDAELMLRPVAESYRIDAFSRVPLLFVGIFLIVLSLMAALGTALTPDDEPDVSLWPGSAALVLSALLFAAFQVDIAAAAWSWTSGSAPTLAAALLVAGIELQVGVPRRSRNAIAGILALLAVIAWLIVWSAAV